MNRRRALTALAFVAVLALHVRSIPKTVLEYDECLFAMGVEHFEPLAHHPPPPGSPAFVFFGKLLVPLTGDPFRALVVVSTLATALGFLAFAKGFAALADWRTGVIAAMVLYGSPSLLMSGTLAMADAGALALFGAGLWAFSARRSALAAIAWGAAVGFRPQFSIAIVPMFLASLLFVRTWRDRMLALAAFAATCLVWLVPLVAAAGGPLSYWRWMSGQTAYYAQHDADLSRSGKSIAQIVLRFVAHPWGPKWLSIPLLALAVAGIRVRTGDDRLPSPREGGERVRVRGGARQIPLALGCLAYLAFAIATMDPADAVRYAIPSLPLIAFLAARTMTRPVLRPLALVYVAGAYWYALPVLDARASATSPPVAAARWIAGNLPRDGVVLYDMPLGPHASYLLRGWKTMRTDAGLARYALAPDVPMVTYADGEPGSSRGVAFRWPDSDAYRKLTRGHYGSVSAIPLPAAERFRVVEGVFAPERTREGESWRWIGRRGSIELPDLGATTARITLRAPPEYPLEANGIRIRTNAQERVVAVQRGQTTVVELALPSGRARIAFEPEQTFVPAEITGANNRDQRTLSVMLTRVEQIGRK